MVGAKRAGGALGVFAIDAFNLFVGSGGGARGRESHLRFLSFIKYDQECVLASTALREVIIKATQGVAH
jgi:hypothetical protein